MAYRPLERFCARCGKMIITRTSGEYVYKYRDHIKGSPTCGKTVFFCSNSCMNKWLEEHSVKRYRRMT